MRDATNWPFRGLARQYVSSATHTYSVTCFQTFRQARRNFSNRLVSQSRFLIVLLHWNQYKKLFLNWIIVFMDDWQVKKICFFFCHWCDIAPGFILIWLSVPTGSFSLIEKSDVVIGKGDNELNDIKNKIWKRRDGGARNVRRMSTYCWSVCRHHH